MIYQEMVKAAGRAILLVAADKGGQGSTGGFAGFHFLGRRGTQARPKRHPSAALMHLGGAGVSGRFAQRALAFICAQINGIPLESCADSFIAPHGNATSRRPTKDPTDSQAPVVAHTNVLELESRPKSYSG
jgi:hypothetical protein